MEHYKYIRENRCGIKLCIYNYKGRCLCRKDELKLGEDNSCISFTPRNRSMKDVLEAFIGDTPLIFDINTLREVTGICADNLGNVKHQVKIKAYYPTRCLVTYMAGKNELRTNLDNQVIVDKVLENRYEEWKKELEDYQAQHLF